MGGTGTVNQRWFESIGIRDDNANSNNFGLNVGGQNANVNFGSLGYENFGLVQEGFGSLSYVGSGSGIGSEFQEELFKEGNIYENREIPLQNYNGGTSTNVAEFNQMGFNNSNFSLAYDMDLLNKMNENNDASAFLQSDLINSIQDVQPLDQLYNGGGDTSLIGNTSCVLNEYSPISVNQNSMQLYLGGDVISSPAEINSCMLNESPMSLDQNFNQLQGNEQFSNGDLYDIFMVDKMSEASTSATTNPKMDMDLFEAVFGTVDN
ncbi:hypothetical protein TSUD_13670 [Trifolium subterraneum]|uniref:Uncharacterized protein n=1 Tax=Trifolium subterraneum TaxID=3900 RepID=A0A2Z6NDI9_TRISU|nr:hypothetical protein TSUD_13670 [Trifolium subterraneum]